MPIRTRKVCGGCGSVTLYRNKHGMYKCSRCDWQSTNPPTAEVNCFSPNDVTHERLLKIKEVHVEHPNYTQKQLIAFVPETMHAVRKYWRDPALNTITPNQD